MIGTEVVEPFVTVEEKAMTTVVVLLSGEATEELKLDGDAGRAEVEELD